MKNQYFLVGIFFLSTYGYVDSISGIYASTRVRCSRKAKGIVQKLGKIANELQFFGGVFMYAVVKPNTFSKVTPDHSHAPLFLQR